MVAQFGSWSALLSGALSAAEADGILGDFVHSAPAEHRDRKLQRGMRTGCLLVIVRAASLSDNDAASGRIGGNVSSALVSSSTLTPKCSVISSSRPVDMTITFPANDS